MENPLVNKVPQPLIFNTVPCIAKPVKLKKVAFSHFFGIVSNSSPFYHSFVYPSLAITRPMSTPITEAIIRPRVQPLESPRQWSPFTLVLKSVSIFTRLL